MTRRVPGEHVVLGEDVARALGAGEPVVALETTVVTHGLPRPDVKNSRDPGVRPHAT
jgi:pseudouridine-5'-phosphate glycosidase